MGHHYTPQHYLRGFADAKYPDALWQFDRRLMRFSNGPSAISKIAQDRQFYDDDTEEMLNRLLETPANPLLQRLREGDFQLTDKDKRILAVYIATMMWRVPRHRTSAVDSVPVALEETTSKLRKWIIAAADAGFTSPATTESRLAELQELSDNLLKPARQCTSADTQSVAIGRYYQARLGDVLAIRARQAGRPLHNYRQSRVFLIVLRARESRIRTDVSDLQ